MPQSSAAARPCDQLCSSLNVCFFTQAGGTQLPCAEVAQTEADQAAKMGKTLDENNAGIAGMISKAATEQDCVSARKLDSRQVRLSGSRGISSIKGSDDGKKFIPCQTGARHNTVRRAELPAALEHSLRTRLRILRARIPQDPGQSSEPPLQTQALLTIRPLL